MDNQHYQQPYQAPSPPPYQQQPPKKKGGCLKVGLIVVGAVVGLILVIGIIGAIVGGDSSSSSTPNSQSLTTAGSAASQSVPVTVSSSTPEPPPTEQGNAIGVGESIDLDGVTVTFLNLTESQGQEFLAPEEGNVFVLFEVEIANNSDEELAISSMLSFSAYCDDYSTSLSISAMMADDGTTSLDTLDGTIAPGKKMRGFVGYEVPADWGKIELNFEPDVWGGGTVTLIAGR